MQCNKNLFLTLIYAFEVRVNLNVARTDIETEGANPWCDEPNYSEIDNPKVEQICFLEPRLEIEIEPKQKYVIQSADVFEVKIKHKI